MDSSQPPVSFTHDGRAVWRNTAVATINRESAVLDSLTRRALTLHKTRFYRNPPELDKQRPDRVVSQFDVEAALRRHWAR